MASRLVHEVHSLVAFGLPYTHVHAKKDAFSRKAPGIRHRQVKHRKYRLFGCTWDFEDPFPAHENHRIERIARWKGDVRAEEYMVSNAHDLDDRCWDREDIPRAERGAVRRYWESLCAWLVLNPDVLKSWAGVDVVAGRIHRVIDGVEVWEDEPTLRPAYAVLYDRVCFLVRRNRSLREALVEYGSSDVAALSNIASEAQRVLRLRRANPAAAGLEQTGLRPAAQPRAR